MRSQLFGSWMAVAAVGILFSGCVESPESDVEEVETPAYAPMGPGGSTGTNGLGDGTLTPVLVPVIYTMKEQIQKSSLSHDINPHYATTLIGLPGGDIVMDYLAACAIPKGEYVQHDTRYFDGIGHMATAKAWLDTPLTPSQQADVFTCLAAHLNPTGHHVTIVLTGINVTDHGPAGNDDFTVPEALWVTTQNVDGVPTYHVLPSERFREMCADPDSAFDDRICGQHPDDCHLSMMKDGDCDDTGPGGTPQCLGIPAVTTWLRPDDVRALHPRCVAPQGGG